MNSHPLLVIKIGGDLLESGATLEATAASIAATQRAGYRVVVVHGGGSEIARWAKALGLTEHKVDGLRVTDAQTAEVALAVLAGTQGKSLAAALGRQGCEAISMCGADAGLLTARVAREGALGFVGEVHEVHTGLIMDLLEQGRTPLIAPMAPLAEGHGPLHNINADAAAGPIAVALGADALLFLTDVEGVLDGQGERIGQLDAEGVAALMAEGVLGAGIVPKVHAALEAVEALPSAHVRIARAPRGGASLHTLLENQEGTLLCTQEALAHD